MSVVDDVKARLDIVDVVGGYVRLQKAGRYFKANCPFHNEKTPSFIVYPERQSWHCFGACGTGGDVIAFVSRKENLDFAGALRLLADRAGVELRDDGPRRETVKTLQDANEAAALYFHSLLQNPSTGAGGPATAARAYVEDRGLDRETISDFQLGYAPPGWDNLKSHLTSRGFDEAKLIEAGLLIETEALAGSGRGRSYDRFRDRIMYPIRDDRGRVVGFGGRVLPSARIDGIDTGPKYMNTPQTPIFDKGGILYGLDRSKDEIRRSGSAVIVEGYMDVIAAHQHGFRNAVASMGTALTDRQALLVQRFTERVVLAMDADEAGSAANLRGVLVVKAATEQTRPSTGSGRTGTRRLDLRVVALPQGKDPDELIRADPTSWTTAIESAQPVIDHWLATKSGQLDLRDPNGRSELVQEVLPLIAEEADPVIQAHYLQRLSRLARVNEDALRRQLPRRPRRRSDAIEGAREPIDSLPTFAAKVKKAPREEFCLALLYARPELAQQARELDEDLFYLSENRELFRRWLHGEAVREDEAGLWEHHQAILTTRIPQSETRQAEQAFLDCVSRLEQVRMRAAKEASALALVEGETGVRPGQVASIARAKLVAGLPAERAGEPDETSNDEAAEAVASLFLADTEAGLRLFNPRSIEEPHSDQTGPPSAS